MLASEIFCASCGKKAGIHTGSHIVARGIQTEASDSSDAANTQRQSTTSADHTTTPLSTLSQESKGSINTNHTTVPIPTEPKAYHTIPIHVIEKEDEEERRRRIAMLDPEFYSPEEEQLSNGALPLSPLADLTTREAIPQVSGTPHLNNAAQIQGTPQFKGNTAAQSIPPQHYSPFGAQPGMSQNADSITNHMPPHLPSAGHPWVPPETPFPPSMPLTPLPHSSGSQAFTQARNGSKWLRIGLIAGLVLVILLLSGMGFSLMASAPTLTLNGSTTVAQGSTLHLNGSHFIPDGTVTLTLDRTTPLNSAYHQEKHAISSKYINTTSAWILGNSLTQTSLSNTTIKVSANGTFSVNIQVGVGWTPGLHTIQATDSLNSRSATLSFTVTQQAPVLTQETATPTASETATSTTTTSPPATPLPIPTPGITPTLTTSRLSGVTPGVLTLGPANAGGQQAVSSIVSLNTTGSALLTWNATWDQQQVPWLQLTPASGRIQAPASQKITVSASSANLKAGTYKALITFTNSLNAQTVNLNIILTIQAGCLKATPTSLTFVGTAGATDPAPQTVTLNNCGLAGTWKAAANSNWLSVKPTSGSIDQNGTQAVAVAVAIASQKLAAGTYQGQILLSNESSQVTIPVTLTVQSPAKLNISQPKLAVSQACQNTARTWTCSETLSSSSAQGSLAWTSSTNGATGVTMNPTNGTIASGQTMVVSIAIPVASCTSNFTLTFTGPANTITVPVDCSGTQPIT
jgi:hypothetical protein